MFTSSIIVLGVYLLAALGPSGAVAFNVNAFGEALPELALFAGLVVPAAAYSCANAIKAQSERLAAFRRLYTRPRAGTDREWRLAGKSLFKQREWRLVTKSLFKQHTDSRPVFSTIVKPSTPEGWRR